MGSKLDSLKWEGNSQKMYKTILAAIPSMFKSMVNREVEAWLVKNNVSVITEDLVIKMFKEKAPKGIMQKVGPKLETMKTQRE